jgi:hypothetical protein
MTRTLAVLALFVAAVTGAQAHERDMTSRRRSRCAAWSACTLDQPHVNVAVLADLAAAGRCGVDAPRQALVAQCAPVDARRSDRRPGIYDCGRFAAGLTAAGAAA